MKTKYIISYNDNTVKVFNAMTGLVIRTLKINGDIVNGPVQSGDQFTLIVRVGNKLQGRIYKLPNCFLIRNFNA